jgi:hypothetical protein
MSQNISLTARIVFRLTPEERRQLAARARREHRGLANLVYIIVRDALQRPMKAQPSKAERP